MGRGKHLDLSSGGPQRRPSQVGRRFIGVHFVCCDVYTRVYVNQEETAYAGNCPKCARPVCVRISRQGTDSRFFTAY